MQSKNNQFMEPYPLSTIQEILDNIEKKKGVRVDIGRHSITYLEQALAGVSKKNKMSLFDIAKIYIDLRTVLPRLFVRVGGWRYR